MASDGQHALTVEWRDVTLVERFSSVLYPLDTLELLRQLPTIGYVVPDLLLGGAPDQDRPLATKGETGLFVNEVSKTIAVRGRDPGRVVDAFEELRTFYRGQLDPSPGLVTQYVELDAKGWAKSRRNPLEVFSAFWHKSGQFRDLAGIMGLDVANFGLQLVPANTDPNRPDWFHFYVEPLVAAIEVQIKGRGLCVDR